jgi:hypothetical protein
VNRPIRKFSLAYAIRRNAKSLAEAQNTYKQNLAAMNTSLIGVLGSSLPQPSRLPPDWSTFAATYEAAAADALDWINNVMTRLLHAPGEVQNFNTLVIILLQDAIAQATLLQQNPRNPVASASLHDDLLDLNAQLSPVIAFVADAIARLRDFADVLPRTAAKLQPIAQASINGAKADRQPIENLDARMQQLQSGIRSFTRQIIALGTAEGVAILLGVITAPPGPRACLKLGAAIAVATTSIGLDARPLVDDSDAIAALVSQIEASTLDVSALTLLASSYAAMADQAGQIQYDLQAVLQQWRTLSRDVSQAISEIQKALADADAAPPIFNLVTEELNEAVTEWSAACAQAGALTVQLHVNNARLQVGMPQAMVQQALQNGQTLDIITYCNQVSAAAKARRRASSHAR